MLYHGTSVSCNPVQFFGLTTANQLAPALVPLLLYGKNPTCPFDPPMQNTIFVIKIYSSVYKLDHLL